MSSVGFIRGPLWQNLIKHSGKRVRKSAGESQREKLRETQDTERSRERESERASTHLNPKTIFWLKPYPFHLALLKGGLWLVPWLTLYPTLFLPWVQTDIFLKGQCRNCVTTIRHTNCGGFLIEGTTFILKIHCKSNVICHIAPRHIRCWHVSTAI